MKKNMLILWMLGSVIFLSTSVLDAENNDKESLLKRYISLCEEFNEGKIEGSEASKAFDKFSKADLMNICDVICEKIEKKEKSPENLMSIFFILNLLKERKEFAYSDLFNIAKDKKLNSVWRDTALGYLIDNEIFDDQHRLTVGDMDYDLWFKTCSEIISDKNESALFRVWLCELGRCIDNSYERIFKKVTKLQPDTKILRESKIPEILANDKRVAEFISALIEFADEKIPPESDGSDLVDTVEGKQPPSKAKDLIIPKALITLIEIRGLNTPLLSKIKELATSKIKDNKDSRGYKELLEKINEFERDAK